MTPTVPLTKKPLWYLAGPMSGYPEFNYPAFERTVWQLRELGYGVVSPHEINGGLHDLSTPESPEQRRRYLQNNIRGLIECTGIVLMPGWTNSKGVWLEVEIAKALCMEIKEVADLALAGERRAGSE